MGDFSDSSQLWWSSVVQITRDAYERWVTASPIERLGVEPGDRPEIIEGKWGRVNAKACAMLMDALDPVVKADLIARKANHSATPFFSGFTPHTSPEGQVSGTLC